jgi:hypothetical protein
MTLRTPLRTLPSLSLVVSLAACASAPAPLPPSPPSGFGPFANNGAPPNVLTQPGASPGVITNNGAPPGVITNNGAPPNVLTQPGAPTWPGSPYGSPVPYAAPYPSPPGYAPAPFATVAPPPPPAPPAAPVAPTEASAREERPSTSAAPTTHEERPAAASSATTSGGTRRHGNLTIPEVPQPRERIDRDLVKTDTSGNFLANSPRVWVGPPVPPYVPAGFEAFELSQLIPTKDGHLAFYRTFFGDEAQGHCPSGTPGNCGYRAKLFGKDGSLKAEIDFNALMPRNDHLRVSELTLVDDTLYYAQACQGYAKEAKGKCSDVVALRIADQQHEVLWRSPFLVSNAPLVVVGDYLITGYGFTAENDFIFILDRKTGMPVYKRHVRTAPTGFEVKDDVLEVYLYGEDAPLRFQMLRFFPTTNAKGKTTPAKPSLTTFK